MNELLVKLLRVYIVGDLNPDTIDKWDKRIALMPNVNNFVEYLRERYHEDERPNPYPIHIDFYRDCVKEWPESLSYFKLALGCMVYCEETEKDYLEVRKERIKDDPNYMIDQREEMTRVMTFREYFKIRQVVISSLENIMELEPDLPLDIAACILKYISDFSLHKTWEKEII
jgi:hypothetical protein